MLSDQDTILVIVDVQGRLAQVMHEKELLVDALQKLIKGTQVLHIPVVWLEQNPEKMGPTIPELRELLVGRAPIGKMSFSCCGEPAFVAQLEALGRKQVLLAGIEAHVCVYQTAAELVARGFEVEVVADAVSSRTLSNKQIGLDKARARGACMTSVEMAIFELLKTAEHPAFRDMLKIVK